MVWTWQRTLAELLEATVSRSDYDLAVGALQFANQRIRVLTDRLEAANRENARLTAQVEQLQSAVERLVAYIQTH